jgi:superfamily II DNA or RNA helicase
MSNIKVHKLNEVYFQLDIEDGPSYDLKKYFSFKVPNYWFSPKYKMGYWDGTISLFDVKNKLLPSGLFKKFTEFCKTYLHTYELCYSVKEMYNELNIDDIYDFSEELMKDTDLDIYDYQAEAVLQCLNRKRGIIESATASGKSNMIYHVIRYLLNIDDSFKILLVVPSVSLVDQMYSDFQSYKWETCNIMCKKLYNNCLYSEKELKSINKTHKVLISTWQSIFKKDEKFFEQFDAIIVDECHGAKSTSIQSVSKKCINAQFRLGFTGTLPVEVSDKYNIYSFLGTPIFLQQATELIERGLLSQLTIGNVIVKYPSEFIEEISKLSGSKYLKEVEMVENYYPRNKVFNFVIDNIEPTDNILFLCRHINHLKQIESFIRVNYSDTHQIYIVYGKIDPEERERVRKLTEDCSGVINYKHIHYIWARHQY